MIRIGAGFALAMTAAIAGAQETVPSAEEAGPVEPVSPPVQLVFTPPDLPGRFVLGVFDDEGSLVRRLVTDRDASVFDIGLNGYITQWDGKNDQGEPCASGSYSASGYVVGENVDVSGEAYHFNDWMAQPGGDRVRDVLSIEFDSEARLEVVLDTVDGKRTAIVDPADGSWRWKATGETATLPGDPAPAESNQAIEPIPPAPGNPPTSLAFEILTSAPGSAGTTWALTGPPEEALIVQLSPQGEVLRALEPSGDNMIPVDLAATAADEMVAVLEKGDNGSRLRILRLLQDVPIETGEDGRTTSDWEIVFDHALRESSHFGISDGEIVPVAESTDLPDEVSIKLLQTDLDPAPQSLELEVKTDGDGTFLATTSGLALVRISHNSEVRRVALVPGENGTVRVFQASENGVEEFVVTNLDQIASFDCGSFVLAAP